jgi:SAM-dependent methyltransferase
VADTNSGFFEGAAGAAYSFYIERPWLARPIGRVVWGGDVRPIYESLRAVGELPEDATVVDAPCGAGLAFRELRPGQRVRYLAIDISTGMLARAGRRARALGLDQIELIQGDAEQLPLADASADLFLSISGLHCLPHPEQGVREIARCLRRGGRVVGCMLCRGDGLRQRFLVRHGVGGFGPGGTPADLARWLADAGLACERLEVSGCLAYFSASA